MINALGILSLILLAVGDVGMAVTGEWYILILSVAYQVLEKYRKYTKQLEDIIND